MYVSRVVVRWEDTRYCFCEGVGLVGKKYKKKGSSRR